MQSLKYFFQKIKGKDKKSLLGLDIGTYSIKCAEITFSNDMPILQSFGQTKTFENTIINKIINNPELLKTHLLNLFHNLVPKSKKISYAIPYELTIFGNFSVNSPEALSEIEKQINEEIPYKLEDVYYSYFILPEKDLFKVYFLVAKKENIDKLKDIVLDINYSLENINADFVILHNFIEYLYGPEEKVIIDWGEEKVKIHFSNKDTPIFTRELYKLGLKQFKNEVVKELKVTTDIAEKYIHSIPEDDRSIKIKDLYIKYIKNLIEEIKISVDIAQKKYNLSPTVYYLIGGGARIANIHYLLTELLKVNVKEIKIEEKMNLSENIDKEYLKIINTQGILAVATAMQEFI